MKIGLCFTIGGLRLMSKIADHHRRGGHEVQCFVLLPQGVCLSDSFHDVCPVQYDPQGTIDAAAMAGLEGFHPYFGGRQVNFVLPDATPLEACIMARISGEGFGPIQHGADPEQFLISILMQMKRVPRER